MIQNIQISEMLSHVDVTSLPVEFNILIPAPSMMVLWCEINTFEGPGVTAFPHEKFHVTHVVRQLRVENWTVNTAFTQPAFVKLVSIQREEDSILLLS